MFKSSRRWFLRRLAAAGVMTWVGVESLTACGQHETPSSTRPTPSTLPTVSTAATASTRAQPKEISLPQPRTRGTMSLEEALSRRRSIRAYTNEPLILEDVGQLFWAAQGVTCSWGARTAPSAGALYPLETYAALAEGLYHYVPSGHRAEVMTQEDVRQSLWAAGLYQEALHQAAVVFVITAAYARTAAKYGPRAERYVKLEAGHAAENLLLQAVALNLGAVVIGAFDDQAVATALHLSATEEPLYLIPVGHPAE